MTTGSRMSQHKDNSLFARVKAGPSPTRSALLLAAAAVSLAACQPEADKGEPQARAVRAVTVARSEVGVPITLTGRIEARDEASLGFRISGRIMENDLKLGDQVKPGQVLARLESQNEENALHAAQARLTAAQAQLTQARNQFERQETLLAGGWTTRPRFDEARQALQTAQSQVDDAQAQLKTA